MMAVTSPAAAQLRRTAVTLAAAYAQGRISPDVLRQQMADMLRVVITAAMLAGTGSRRNADIDAALRRAIQRELNELDNLITLLAERPAMEQAEVQQRLEAFADALDEVQAEGERLAERRTIPLVPIAVGAGLAALIAAFTRRRPPTPDTAPARQMLPRLDVGQTAQVYNQLQQRIDSLSEMLNNGELLLDDWHERMRREIDILHRTLYRAGVGRDLTPADRARIQARVDEQWRYLQGFYDDVAAGRQSPQQIARRARLYLDAGKTSLQQAAVARFGMPELPVYPGQRSDCLTACKCGWEVRTVDGGWDAYWRLRPAEHCDQCVRRAAVWNPLRIRGGVIQPYDSAGLYT